MEKSLIHYYAYAGLHRHIITVCDEVIKKKGNDPILVFWRGFGNAMEGNYAEAIRDMEAIAGRKDVALPAIVALQQFHQQAAMVDDAALEDLAGRESAAEGTASEDGLLMTARFYWHWRIGSVSKARKYIQKVLKTSPDNPRALSLQGLIALSVGSSNRRDAETFDASIGWFEQVIAQGYVDVFEVRRAKSHNLATSAKPELEALIGAARYWEVKRDYAKALDKLSNVTVHYPWFVPGAAQKAIVLMMSNNWDGAMEVAQRLLEQDSYDVQGLTVYVMGCLVHESRPAEAVSKLSEILDALNRFEPKNPSLYYNVARPVARVAGGNTQILALAAQLINRACELDPLKGEYAFELGYIKRLMQDYAGAEAAFAHAASIEDVNTISVQGQVFCQLQLGKLQEAEEQLQFLAAFQDQNGRSATDAQLDALFNWRKNGSIKKQLKYLDEAVQLHFSALSNAESKGEATGFQYFVQLNPAFVVELARDYMAHCGAEPIEATETPAEFLVKGKSLLETLTAKAPGMLQAQLMLANAWYIMRDFEGAMRSIQKCLRLDATVASAHMLQAQVYLQMENYRGADAALQQAFSHDFQIRNRPTFHLIKAKILEAQGLLEDAILVLEEAMGLPGVGPSDAAGGATPTPAAPAAGAAGGRGRAAAGAKGGASGAARGGATPTPAAVPMVSLQDRASIYVKLAELNTKLGRIPAATKLVTNAMHEFAGTSEEVRVIVANSEIALKRGDIDAAIHMLETVPADTPAFVKAQMVKADIYLSHRKDRRLYAKCYKELVTRNKSKSTYVSLGEAYMRIQMPEEAIAAFEQALSLDPTDSYLASKIGKARVSTHDYEGAIEYYKTALQHNPSNASLRSDLTELYCRLQKFREASALLDVALADTTSDDAHSLMATVRNLLLLARVHKGMNNTEETCNALTRAQQAQSQVLTKLRGDAGGTGVVQRSRERETHAVGATDLLREQRVVSADISAQLAQFYEDQHDEAKAKQYYNQALKSFNAHEASMLALARMHLARGEFDDCQHQCVTLMRVDPNNEHASMMLADVMFRKNEAEAAMYHFQQLLEKKPRHYAALAKLISLLKRAGKLNEVPRFLKMAEKSSPRAVHEPGFRYCRGLYYKYNNDPHEAIADFNQIRQIGEFGDAAAEHMIEIYLAPDAENLWTDGEEKESAVSAESIRVAEKLLREIPGRPFTVRQQVLECYSLLATRSKGNVESVVQRMGELVNADQENVSALLCMAAALTVQGKTTPARNLLKRVAKMNYMQEDADDYIRAWLMLADAYITTGKFDMAQELCKRCLTYDKSCAKAWEHLGSIMERDQAYKDAASHYEQAWLHSHQASGSIGYKLAFNYLKAKRYVDAIEVCHKVLEAFPDYPRIRKEILEKARASLRP